MGNFTKSEFKKKRDMEVAVELRKRKSMKGSFGTLAEDAQW